MSKFQDYMARLESPFVAPGDHWYYRSRTTLIRALYPFQYEFNGPTRRYRRSRAERKAFRATLPPVLPDSDLDVIIDELLL